MTIPDHRDLWAACLWVTASAISVSISDSTLIRGFLSVPTILFVSGHPLVRAGVRTSSIFEHVIFAIGASLALGVLGGFVLNSVGMLTPSGWAGWYLLVTSAGALIAATRRDVPDRLSWPRLPGLQPRHIAAFALAALLATGSYAVAVRDESSQRQFKYTELWLLPSANGGELTVGIKSAEAGPERFDLEISFDGRPFSAFRSFAISPGELWTREIPAPQGTALKKAEARLYRLKDMRLYRRVSALVPASD
jgi:hypothetical protein